MITDLFSIIGFFFVRYLLKFGKVSDYLGYNALLDFFPQMQLKVNPLCDDANCRLRQKEAESDPEILSVPSETPDEAVVHEDNEWGISLVDETPAEELKEESKEVLAEGLKRAYDAPIIESANAESVDEVSTSLDELMAQMKSM